MIKLPLRAGAYRAIGTPTLATVASSDLDYDNIGLRYVTLLRGTACCVITMSIADGLIECAANNGWYTADKKEIIDYLDDKFDGITDWGELT